MTLEFDLHRLDTLDHDDALAFLGDYIDILIERFAQSPEGQAHTEAYPDFGGWIRPLIELGYTYEGFTLPKMTQRDVERLMESLLPRKITVLDAADTEDAIPELVAFWSFLQREYNLSNAASIMTYLRSIQDQFGEWMMDPARGGMTKNFMMAGMKAGFDMTTQEGLSAFQQVYNAKIRQRTAKDSWMQQLAGLLGKSPPAETPQLPTSKSAKKQSKAKQQGKGFGASGASKSSKRKQK